MGDPRVIHDRYRLAERIGRGGMAEVWRAHDLHLSRDVAVKFMESRLHEDPEFLVRFFAEAQAAARINHPHVVQVLDFGEVNGHPFLVMELVEGGAISAADGPWDPQRAAALVAQAAEGAGAAHEAGLVHRDIKPGNILIDSNGFAKLADFGIAASQGGESLTQTGTAIGSPHYISPEQAQGAEATSASDVYAFGAVLYELLTGRPPFDAENVTAIAIAHVEKAPVPPSEIVPSVPPEIEDVVLTCLSKDPAERPANGAALAAALGSASHQAPAAASAPMVASGFPARRKVIAVAAALLVGASGLALASSIDRNEPAVAGTAGFDRNLDHTPKPVKTDQPTEDDEAAETVSDETATPSPDPSEGTADPKAEDVSGFEEPQDEDRVDRDEREEEELDGEEEGSDPTPTPAPSTPQPAPTTPGADGQEAEAAADDRATPQPTETPAP